MPRNCPVAAHCSGGTICFFVVDCNKDHPVAQKTCYIAQFDIRCHVEKFFGQQPVLDGVISCRQVYKGNLSTSSASHPQCVG